MNFKFSNKETMSLSKNTVRHHAPYTRTYKHTHTHTYKCTDTFATKAFTLIKSKAVTRTKTKTRLYITHSHLQGYHT